MMKAVVINRQMKKYLIIFLIIIPGLLLSGRAAGRLLPPGQPEYELLYDLYRRHEISGAYRTFNHNVAPYNLDRAAVTIDYPVPPAPDNNHIGILIQVTEAYRSARYARARANESFRGALIADPIENVYLYGDFLIDEGLAEDPAYTGKIWRGFAGRVETAVASVTWRNFDFLFGRYGSFWGPVDHSLVLSETARPMDAFSFRFLWGRFHFTYQFGKLVPLDNPAGPDTAFENRFFAGHRLDIRLRENVRIGLFETIVFGGPGRSPDLSYLNPFLSFHAVQLNEDIDDNTFLGADFSFYHAERYKIYGQLLIDDFQVDDDTRGDQEPGEIGLVFGLQALDLPGSIDLHTEYLRIANRTYNQRLTRNRYVNRGQFIGHEFGPDGDRTMISITRWFHDNDRVVLNLSYQRRGEGNDDDFWDDPWLQVDQYDESFPTGVVEKTLTASGCFDGIIAGRFFLSLETGLMRIFDFENRAGENRSVPFFEARLSLLLPILAPVD